MTTTAGRIYWIGTGPGDPGLITVKGRALVQEADAVVGDALRLARLLRQARPDAEIHDVGSRTRGNKWPPERVEQLLLELAQAGKTVVRLWPGDPFVFGRAAEEMAAARQANLPVALVPGVSSALAAPAYAGVPVTHWDHSAGFAVITGFVPPKSPTAPNWSALAQLDTLIVLMPLENLPQIVDNLYAAGRGADTPVLLVQHGTAPHQKQLVTRLDGLVEAAAKHDFAEPTVLVVGQVVRLAETLRWFQPEAYPLLGQRILVTRPVHQSAEFMAALRDLGADPISFPTIEVRPVEDTTRLDRAIHHIRHVTKQQIAGTASEPSEPAYQWLVLTSVNGVEAFWDRLTALGYDSRILASVKIAAIGPATAKALRQHSIEPDLVPAVYTAEGVLEAFDRQQSVAGQRFLLARSDLARQTLATGLAEQGAIVDEVPAYRTVPVEKGPLPPQADIVTFTSSSTVQGYVNCLQGQEPATVLQQSKVVCIGPITAGTARDLGVPVHAVAETYTIDGILETLQGGVI